MVREYKIKKKTFDLLPNGEENIVKLRAAANESAAALVQLAVEWETRRTPLIARCREVITVSIYMFLVSLNVT